jgi:hypothetical protein
MEDGVRAQNRKPWASSWSTATPVFDSTSTGSVNQRRLWRWRHVSGSALYCPDSTELAGCHLKDSMENESNQRVPFLACDRDGRITVRGQRVDRPD